MAFDAFLKISTIPGESKDDKYKDHIEILSYNHTVSQDGTGSHSRAGANTVGRVDHGDFHIVKHLDKASPKLNLACCNGEHLSNVTLFLCRASKDKKKYMEYKMSDVIVRSIRPGGSSQSANGLPLEEVSFAYGKMEWTYTQIDPDGNSKGDVKATWDLHANKGS